MLKYYLFNLYILIILYNKNKGEDSIKYLILPFRTEIQEITKDNYLSIYYDNKIFIDIEVGTPPQKIPINLKFENYPFFIISSQSENLPKKYFNETKSSSYKKNSSNPYNISRELFSECYFSNDTVNLNQNIIKEFNFILASKMNNKEINYSGQIGLRLGPTTKERNEKTADYNFINSLKKNGKISGYEFTFIYKTENEGDLIIGSRLDEIDKKNYNFNNFITTKGAEPTYPTRWQITFDNIYFNNYSNQSIQVDLYIENGFMQCPDYFFDAFKLSFFENYIKNNICTIKIHFYTRFIICEKDFDINNFGNISFELKDIQKNFTFTNQNLFYDIKNVGKLFIFSNRQLSNNWRFGKPFFTSFNITFNKDRKIIGLYKKLGGIDEQNLRLFNIISLIICLMTSIFVCGLLIYIAFFRANKQSKLRAQELQEDDVYMENLLNKK